MMKYVICVKGKKIVYSGSNLLLIKMYDKLFSKSTKVKRFKFKDYDSFKKAEYRLKQKGMVEQLYGTDIL